MFEKRLKFQLWCKFNLDKAEELSEDIQKAEGNGHQLSRREERLWEHLTNSIQNQLRLLGRK